MNYQLKRKLVTYTTVTTTTRTETLIPPLPTICWSIMQMIFFLSQTCSLLLITFNFLSLSPSLSILGPPNRIFFSVLLTIGRQCFIYLSFLGQNVGSSISRCAMATMARLAATVMEKRLRQGFTSAAPKTIIFTTQ